MCIRDRILDVVYAVDTSREVNKDLLEKMTNFVEKSLGSYIISPKQTNVGLLQYGKDVTVKVPLHMGFDKSTITQNLKQLALTSDPRRMDIAMEVAKSQLFSSSSRKNASKVLVLLTTGENDPSGKSQLSKVAEELKEIGVKIVVLAIGSKDNPDTDDIVSNPDKVIKTDSTDLVDKIGELEKEIGKSFSMFYCYFMFMFCFFC